MFDLLQYLRSAYMVPVAALFAVAIPMNTPQAQEEPHAYCWSLKASVLAGDDGALALAQKFQSRVDDNFDIKGFEIVEVDDLDEMVTGIQSNSFDFAILPIGDGDPVVAEFAAKEKEMGVDAFHEYMEANRINVLSSCCSLEDEQKVGDDNVEAALGLLAHDDDMGVNYKITSSSKIKEVGYEYRELLQRTAAEGVKDFAEDLVGAVE